ncbi:serine hydrolase domain-containing protein [uncultured Cohaesibacter sp.]|uniref:serine hydrolase domain-containing protein n=1 Tax=uncultured Cohaesibacter sp. TaxID=1002546 RepID=UPI00292E7D9D|nr:serine hydrolase domain-containing protein [uncultured Cohaesibacter sp.]
MRTTLNWHAAEQAAKSITDKWKANEPGGVILGFDAAGVRFSVAGGLESLNGDVAFSSTSVGRFASVTKHFFCSLVLRHLDLISLDDRLGQHLPQLQKPLADVTVEQALSMTGGLPDNRECLTLVGLSVYSETSSRGNLDMTARQTRLNFAPGTETSYSNTGYRLVEHILEKKGVYLKDFLEAEINKDLGTHFDAPHVWADPVRGLVPGYWFNGQKWLQSAAGLQISAAGSVTASVTDMSLWLRTLMAGEGKWLGILDQLATSRTLNDGTRTGYGLGMTDTILGDRTFIGHGGSHPGYKSYIMMDRDNGLGLIFLSNREDTDARGSVSKVMATLHDLALPKPSADRLPDGLYVADSGSLWLEIEGETATWLSDSGVLYEQGENEVSTRSSTSQLNLKREGDRLVGKIGFADCALSPVGHVDVPASLDGLWYNEEGAFVTIKNGTLTMGAGPNRKDMALRALGNGRYLFTLIDSLWTKRVCLNQLDEGRFELVTSRARMMEYCRVKP